MPFIFLLFKIYLNGNPQYDEIKHKRDIKYKDLKPDDFIPDIEQVIFFYLDNIEYYLQYDHWSTFYDNFKTIGCSNVY